MQLKINLATRNYIDAFKLNSVLTICTVLLLAFMVVNILYIAKNAGELKRIAGETNFLQEKSRTGGKAVPEADYKALLARIQFANGVIEKKSFNWLLLLNRLEEVVPDGVAISEIEPDIKEQTLKLAGKTRSFNSLRRLLENMEKSTYYSDIFLLSQSQIKVGLSQKGITFTVSCRADYK